MPHGPVYPTSIRYCISFTYFTLKTARKLILFTVATLPGVILLKYAPLQTSVFHVHTVYL
jgi:hypothetical protein